MIRKAIRIIIVLFISLQATAQIDSSLLLGLRSATTAEINSITNPIAGTLIYNSENGRMYINTGSGFAKIPAIDNNSIDFWGVTGSLGTDSSVNFLGTTDAQDMVFRTNNIEAFRILQNNQNIGLGVPIPSEKLDINGNLRVRSIATTTSDLDVLVTTATGVVQKRAFTDFEGNDGVSVTEVDLNIDKELLVILSDGTILNAGQVINPKLNFGARWTNADVTTDLNINNTIVPIFGNQNYKDGGNNLYEVVGNTLEVKEAGRYDIRANISLLGDDSNGGQQRTNVSARIAVNGNVVGALGGSYIRFQNATSYNNTSSAHVSEILELNANDIISILTFRKANIGVVNFSGVNESSFTINKLR